MYAHVHTVVSIRYCDVNIGLHYDQSDCVKAEYWYRPISPLIYGVSVSTIV